VTVNVTEANAVFRLLDWLAGSRRYLHQPEVSDADALTAIATIGASAGNRLRVTFPPERAAEVHASIAGRLAAVDSDGLAQAVCRALVQHESHGGSIPWPSVR
jgi:hypothetical protein